MYISLPLPVFTILSTLALTSALPPSLRDILPTGQTIKQDVINIHNAVLSLDATVQAYTGAPFPTSLVGGTPVLLGVAEIHEVNRAGFRHALAAVMFSVEDTKEVIDTVVSTVNVSIPASTQHLQEKEPEFKESGFSAVVIGSLSLLLSDHDTFSAAVLAKSNAGVGQAELQRAQDAVQNIHNAIQAAIVFYAENAV